jgi:hypothetical protein
MEPFFSENEELYLGEKHIPFGYFKYFLMGDVICYLNSIGIVDYDIHPENWIADTRGEVSCVDIGGAEIMPITPQAAAEMLEGPFLTFEPNQFKALLSGYLTHSIAYLDSIQESFTEDLLCLLGGNIATMPNIRLRRINYNQRS